MKEPISKIFSVVINSINFIILSYLLLSALYSFKTDFVFVLFFACNCWLISIFDKILSYSISSKILKILIFILNLLILFLIFLETGYVSMALLPINM